MTLELSRRGFLQMGLTAGAPDMFVGIVYRTL